MKSARVFLLVGAFMILAFSLLVYADVPQMINYQGKLTTPGGALMDTTVQMIFSIYVYSTSVFPLWAETLSTVVVEKGVFSVVLGITNPIDSDDFYWNDSLFLGVKVGTDPEMTPRKRIASSGYAITDGDWWESNNSLYRFEGSVYIGAGMFGGEGTRDVDYQNWCKLEVGGDNACAIYGYMYPYFYPEREEQLYYHGVIGEVYAEGSYNYGVLGYAGSSSGTQFGLYGIAEYYSRGTSNRSSQDYGICNGVYGEGWGYEEMITGVWGYAGGGGELLGIVGESNYNNTDEFGWNCGVWGFAYNASENYGLVGEAPYQEGSYAGYFFGNVYVEGSIYQPLGSVKMDHPLDPENRYLQHSLVESPDMMNVYNGNVVLDERGEAKVELPAYFEALNKDFRYQLTCIGGFAPVFVATEISGNQFAIAGGEPGMKVSWQVSGIRKDPWAEANRIQTEVDKPLKEKGKYLHPEAYGLGKEYGTRYELLKKMEEQKQLQDQQREQRKVNQEKRLEAKR